MSHTREPIFWFLAVSLLFHAALGWGGVFSLGKPPSPPIKVHRLKLTTCLPAPAAPEAAASASKPKARPQRPPLHRPRPRKLTKPRPRPQPKPLARPAPKPKPASSPPSVSGPATTMAKATGRGISGPGAREAVGASGLTGQGHGRTALQAERRYLSLIRARIIAHRRYPALSRRRGHEGVVRVRFVVGRNGALNGGVQLVRSSGHGQLDQQAKKSVLAAAPFPPFPPNLYKTRLTVVVPIAFRLTHGDS